MVIARTLAALAALTAPLPASACAAALALGLDVSSSVDQTEYALQRGGLARAFRHPDVVDAVIGGGGVMATVYEWSGFHQQDVIVGWRWLGDAAAIAAFADAVEAGPRLRDSWPTALGRGVDFGARLHALNPRDCARRIVDISGDGLNNHGAGPDWYARQGMLEGLVVNGLAVQGDTADLADYYRDNLIHGPGAFVEAARDYADFPRAILRKLVRELDAPLASARGLR